MKTRMGKSMMRLAVFPRESRTGVVVSMLILAWATSLPLAAQVVTNPAGFNRILCRGGSDTLISIPFTRSPIYTGKLVGKMDLPGGKVSLATEEASPFVSGEFLSSPHYIRFRKGSSGEGHWYDITDNSVNSVTIEPNNAGADSIAPGDTFDIVPHWTLSTVWPVDTQTSLYASANKLLSGRGSMVLFTDVTSLGANLAPNRMFFLTSSGWFQVGGDFPGANEQVIPPGQTLVIRHPESVSDTMFFTSNFVALAKQGVWLRTSRDGPSDNHLGIVRPVPVSLSQLDLDSVAFMDSASDDLAQRKDQLLVFENPEASRNQSPDRIFFRVGGVWREDKEGTFFDADTALLEPSAALVIRKTATLDGASVLWTNTARY